jgi:hypothetical protein
MLIDWWFGFSWCCVVWRGWQIPTFRTNPATQCKIPSNQNSQHQRWNLSRWTVFRFWTRSRLAVITRCERQGLLGNGSNFMDFPHGHGRFRNHADILSLFKSSWSLRWLWTDVIQKCQSDICAISRFRVYGRWKYCFVFWSVENGDRLYMADMGNREIFHGRDISNVFTEAWWNIGVSPGIERVYALVTYV